MSLLPQRLRAAREEAAQRQGETDRELASLRRSLELQRELGDRASEEAAQYKSKMAGLMDLVREVEEKHSAAQQAADRARQLAEQDAADSRRQLEDLRRQLQEGGAGTAAVLLSRSKESVAGLSFAELYSRYQEAVDALELERGEKRRLERALEE